MGRPPQITKAEIDAVNQLEKKDGEMIVYVPPEYLGAQLGKYTQILEGHYWAYMDKGPVAFDKATQVMVQLAKLSVQLIKARALARLAVPANPNEPKNADIEAEVSQMGDEQIAEALKQEGVGE